MKSLTFYEQQHLQKLLQQQGSVKYIFDDFVRQAGPLLARWSDHNKASVWVGNQTVENSIERLLSDLHGRLLANITDNMVQSWNRGNKKADDLVSGFIKDLSISDTLRDKMFSRNAEALNAMLNKKDEYGLTVSDRVWNIANGAKDNLEYYLASGLSSSRPSALISQDVRQLLQQPDKRFHRVRDKNGNLVPSQPMKDYHPGQGVYRSAYKNALRLSSTQTNKAFRSADYERWKKMDFVLGIEVERSPSHKGPCPICDALAGRYSKEYKFTGHHPFCICIATPIMMDHEEFAEYLIGNDIEDRRSGEDTPNINNLRSVTQTEKPSFKGVQDVVNYIQSNIAATTSLTIKKSDLPILEDILSQISNRMQAFGIPKFTRLGVPSKKTAHASFDSHEYALNLNLSKLRNPKSIWNAENKWRAKGIKYSAIIDEQDVVRSTIDHEIGHAVYSKYQMSMATINTFGNARVTRDGINEVNDILGYYASTSVDEYFAEAFSLFVSRDKEKLGKYTSDLMKELMTKVKALKAGNSKK